MEDALLLISIIALYGLGCWLELDVREMELKKKLKDR